tara:strand:- start:867 stop:1631 length:765 start_codon:yes stop_codon:yes gene_type:complete
MSARQYEMAILQREDKIGLLLPNNLKKSGGYVKKLAFECDLLIKNNAALGKCDPMTIMMGVVAAASKGLSFTDGDAFLVPYKSRAVFILSARGIATVLYRTGLVSKVKWGTVFEGDHFEYSESIGEKEFITHKKALRDRGGLVCAYAGVLMKDGSSHVYVMDYDELMKIKDASPSSSDKRSPYNVWPEEMYGKAPMKRLFKRLPIDGLTSKEVAKALDDLGQDRVSFNDVEQGVVSFDEDIAEEPEEAGVSDAA